MISIANIGSKEEPYPIIENYWEFFSEKGMKTIFVSIGTGSSCLPDLEFAETIGCPLLKLDTPDNSKKWDEVKDILKSRKPNEKTSEFTKPAARKWVLPRNLHIQTELPSFYNGTIEHEGQTIQTKRWYEILEPYCKAVGLPENDVHIDFLKVDQSPFTASVLESLWQSGFRPSLLLIHWIESPDSSLQSTLSAGHLQMLGYTLLGKEGNRFLYYYTDVNYYETTSWESISKMCENPLISNLLQSVLPGARGSVVHFPLEK